MSAVKHIGAKTVYIPLNSKTGKRRNFAIIGFQDNINLEKAITQYIYLFDCKTWWSTKDNTKALQRQQNKKGDKSQYTRYNKYQESDQDSDSELDKYEEEPKNQQKNIHANHSNKKQKNIKEGKGKNHWDSNTTNNIDNMFDQLTRQLSLLNDRLANLESHKCKNNKCKKEIRTRPNLS